MYDLTYGPGSGATNSLIVNSDRGEAAGSAASAVMASIITSNGAAIGNSLQAFVGAPTPMFSTALMSSFLRLPFGG